jgi:hypothetical protein
MAPMQCFIEIFLEKEISVVTLVSLFIYSEHKTSPPEHVIMPCLSASV